MEEYRVKLEIFEGPFDLLLYLIRVNEMDIYDISISEITRQYLDYIRVMQQMNLDIAGDFLVMAATLIRIKAQQLLPTPDDTDTDEEIDEILSTRDLIKQIIEYRRIKELAGELQDRHEEFSRIFYRDEKSKYLLPDEQEIDEARQQLQLDLQTLFFAFSRVLPYVEMGGITHLIPERYTVDEKISNIRDLLYASRCMTFIDLVRSCADREELIVTFLALMELCRRREIRVLQDSAFGEISISLRDEEPIEDNDQEEEHTESGEELPPEF